MPNKRVRIQIKVRVKEVSGFFLLTIASTVIPASPQRGLGRVLQKTQDALLSDIVKQGRSYYSGEVAFQSHFHLSTAEKCDLCL